MLPCLHVVKFIMVSQARAQVDSFLSVFTFRVEKALAAFPPHIVGHMDLVWDRLNEVIDKRIDEIIDEHKVNLIKTCASL